MSQAVTRILILPRQNRIPPIGRSWKASPEKQEAEYLQGET